MLPSICSWFLVHFHDFLFNFPKRSRFSADFVRIFFSYSWFASHFSRIYSWFSPPRFFDSPPPRRPLIPSHCFYSFAGTWSRSQTTPPAAFPELSSWKKHYLMKLLSSTTPPTLSNQHLHQQRPLFFWSPSFHLFHCSPLPLLSIIVSIVRFNNVSL